MNNISYQIAENAPTKDEDPVVLLDYLNATYGEKTLWTMNQKFDSHRMKRINPDLFINDLEILEGKVTLAGGTVFPKQWFTVMTRNIRPEFYQEFY
jgi:hypothetical protein